MYISKSIGYNEKKTPKAPCTRKADRVEVILVMTILFGADLVPTPSNFDRFSAADIDALVDRPLQDVLFSADHRIFNLELALTDRPSPVVKCGPAIAAPTATVAGIAALRPSLLTLANNHVRDHGVRGLHDTVHTLDAAGIPHIGAADTLEEADRPFVLEDGEHTVCIYSCAEHEFTIIEDGIGGANPFEPLDTPDRIAALKAQYDRVVVLYHGGKEHYRYPSPSLRKTCRKLVEKGADLVICQHTHCVGCAEQYAGGTVVYGQGNFLFDHLDNEYWQTSMLVSADVSDGLTVRYIPIVKNGIGVRLANADESADILEGLHSRSAHLDDDEFLRANYLEAIRPEIPHYLYMLAGSRGSGQPFCEGFGDHYTPHELGAMFNCLNCEVHRETITAYLWDLIKQADPNLKED